MYTINFDFAFIRLHVYINVSHAKFPIYLNELHVSCEARIALVDRKYARFDVQNLVGDRGN